MIVTNEFMEFIKFINLWKLPYSLNTRFSSSVHADTHISSLFISVKLEFSLNTPM